MCVCASVSAVRAHVDIDSGDGIIVVGGEDRHPSAGARLLDVFGARWELQPGLAAPRAFAAAAVCSLTGDAVVTGGSDGCARLAGVERLAPRAVMWAPGAPLPHARIDHAATPAPGGAGGVAVVGGYNGTSLRTGAVLLPDAAAWAALPDMREFRAGCAAACTGGGSVVVTGGCTGRVNLPSVEVLGPDAAAWTSAPHMSCDRVFHVCTALSGVCAALRCCCCCGGGGGGGGGGGCSCCIARV
jgi:hypothetical protein